MRNVSCFDLTVSGSADIAVASAVVVYTKSFKLSFADYFGLFYKAVSAGGTPDIKIELQTSYDVPTTEEAADTKYVEPENMADIESSLITETLHHKAINPPPAVYARFKITGNAANPADTVVNLKVAMQEEL